MATVPSRAGNYAPLMLSRLEKQCEGLPVEFLWFGDNKKRSIGQKRNDLVNLAQGRYVVFVDDDDFIHKNYVEVILAAAEANKDCICFKEFRTVDRWPDKEVHFSIGFLGNKTEADRYVRLPHHRMPIKKELVVQVPFKDTNFGEDTDFGIRIQALLKSETVIPACLYFYDYDSDISEAKP